MKPALSTCHSDVMGYDHLNLNAARITATIDDAPPADVICIVSIGTNVSHTFPHRSAIGGFARKHSGTLGNNRII